MWSITSLEPTLQQVVGAGAETRIRRDAYITEMGKQEEVRYLEEQRRQGVGITFFVVNYSSRLHHFSQSFFYQALRYLIVTASFFTIAFAVNGSVNTSAKADAYDTFNIWLDSCFVADGIVKALAVYSYAWRLQNYDLLNARLSCCEAERVVLKYTWYKVFKNSGCVDFIIAIFCLFYNGKEVADWFRLVRIVIISVWALENEPRIAVLLSGIHHGFMSMRSLLALMLLINVIFASIAITFFAENDPYNFGSMPIAMWSFFEMSTMEGWSVVMAINRLGCDSVPESDYEMLSNETTISIHRYGGEFFMPVCSEPKEQPFTSMIIFLAYMIIVGFILTSITIGAISTGINERFDVLRSHQMLVERADVEGDTSRPSSPAPLPHDGKTPANNRSDPSLSSLAPYDAQNGANCSDNVSHLEIYKEEQEEFSFSREQKEVPAAAEKSSGLGNTPVTTTIGKDRTGAKDTIDLSDLSFRQLNKRFVPPTLSNKKSAQSRQDQFSFRTCKEGEDAERVDEEYEIFSTEVQECLDIIRLEREVNMADRSIKRNKKKKLVTRSQSNVYLKGQLTKTVTGLKRSDLRFHEMKSKNFHVLMYKLKKFVYGDAYGFLTLMFIFAAAMFEIATLSNPNQDFHHSDEEIYKIQLFFQLVFTMDILIRFVAMFPRYHQFLSYQWNMFDFTIVLVLWLPFLIDILEKYIRLLRVLRLVALIKFMKWIPQLAFILDAIVSSVRLLLYTVLLMGMCFYYFAVAGVLLFKDNDHEHFGKLHTSFLSMVSVATFDNWATICRINMYGCDMLGYDTGEAFFDEQCVSPEGKGWWACLYFFVFIIFVNYILMNLLISIIITSMEISYHNSRAVEKMWQRIAQKKEKYQLSNLLMKKILAVFVILDFNTSCAISLSASTPLFEFLSITEHSEVIDIFNKVVPRGVVHADHGSVDEDMLGSIDFPEFIEMLFVLEKRNREMAAAKDMEGNTLAIDTDATEE